MKREFFDRELTNQTANIIAPVEKLHQQETDWTCAIACLRTICNSSKSEQQWIEKLQAKPGPRYSADIKKVFGNKFIYGCDQRLDFEQILELLKTHNIMLEVMINYAHWVVLLGFFHFSNDQIDNICLIYDPYYHELRLVHAEELISMWHDGDHNVEK